jgi:hypothetical protein
MPDKWGGLISWRAAATFHAGRWWPVLEVPIHGIPPNRVTRGEGFTNHGAAMAAARDIIKALENEAADYLVPYHLRPLMEDNTDERETVSSS